MNIGISSRTEDHGLRTEDREQETGNRTMEFIQEVLYWLFSTFKYEN